MLGLFAAVALSHAGLCAHMIEVEFNPRWLADGSFKPAAHHPDDDFGFMHDTGIAGVFVSRVAMEPHPHSANQNQADWHFAAYDMFASQGLSAGGQNRTLIGSWWDEEHGNRLTGPRRTSCEAQSKAYRRATAQVLEGHLDSQGLVIFGKPPNDTIVNSPWAQFGAGDMSCVPDGRLSGICGTPCFFGSCFRVLGRIASIDRSADSHGERQKTNQCSDAPDPPSRVGRALSGIRSLPLGTKIAGTIVVAFGAWLVVLAGVLRLIGRGGILRGGIYVLIGCAGILSSSVFWMGG
jgi:hypothetical protein